MNDLVSIVVPVYNAQKFLNRCIESVINQDYKNIELILVNDGSTDLSSKICQWFADRDKRIKYIEKENSGVSDTRNIGIESSKGKFIQFVDSDDWLTSDSTSSLVKAQQTSNADMIIAEFYRVVGTKLSRKGNIYVNQLMSIQTFVDFMIEGSADVYYSVLWNKLYRSDIIKKYNIKMDKDVSFAEDVKFNLDYMSHIHTVRSINTSIYYYVKNKRSLSRVSVTKFMSNRLDLEKEIDAFCKKIYTTAEYKEKEVKIKSFIRRFATDF